MCELENKLILVKYKIYQDEQTTDGLLIPTLESIFKQRKKKGREEEWREQTKRNKEMKLVEVRENKRYLQSYLNQV